MGFTTLSNISDLFILAADVPSQGVSRGSSPLLFIPAITLLASVLCGLCAAFKVRSKLPAWISVAGLASCFALVATTFMAHKGGVQIAHGFEWITFHWREGSQFVANFSLFVDPLTLVWMLFVTGLATLIALYASEYMSHDCGVGYCRFFAAFNLFVFSMACLVMADNLVLLYLGWEGVGLCSYLLIGYFYKKPSAVAAAKKAFIVNRIGDLFLALGVFLTFVHFGSVEYAVVFEKAQVYIDAMKAGKFDQVPMIAQLIPVLLMGGAFGKSAQLPLYVWLPDAMEGPTPVSALIHAATMVTAGVFLVARTYPLFLCSTWALPAVAWVGSLTALLAATIGMAQFDIKRIMAYSTVSQLGYMFAGLGVLTSMGGVFHVVTHAFFKALLFLCCGAVMHGFGGQLDLRKLSGVMKMPGWRVVGIGMLIGCVNLAGFPGTAGFFSKDMILAESFVTPGMAPIGIILLLTAGLTAYYTFRVFFRVFVGPVHFEMGEESHGDDHGHAHEHGHGHGHGHGQGQDPHAAHADPGHGDRPHAPGWAINAVLATLTALSLAASGLYFLGGSHGAVANLVQQSSAAFETPFAHHEASGDAHAGADHRAPSFTPMFVHADAAAHEGEIHGGTFFGFDPHKAMYFVSSVVGVAGIVIAFVLHFMGRTSAATSKADALLPAMGPLAKWAQDKWFVDEFYDFLIVKPLHVLAHIFHAIDQFLVDGLVNFLGYLPKALGKSIRPSQSGELHGYAVGMAGGMAVLLLIVLLVVLR